MKLVKRNRLLILSFVFAFVLLACSQNKIDEDTLARIYVEKIVVEETFGSKPNQLTIKLNELFKKYKTTKGEFEKELKLIGTDKESWERFFKKANIILNNLKNSGAIS